MESPQHDVELLFEHPDFWAYGYDSLGAMPSADNRVVVVKWFDPERNVSWLTRNGLTQTNVSANGRLLHACLTPNGHRVAVVTQNNTDDGSGTIDQIFINNELRWQTDPGFKTAQMAWANGGLDLLWSGWDEDGSPQDDGDCSHECQGCNHGCRPSVEPTRFFRNGLDVTRELSFTVLQNEIGHEFVGITKNGRTFRCFDDGRPDEPVADEDEPDESTAPQVQTVQRPDGRTQVVTQRWVRTERKIDQRFGQDGFVFSPRQPELCAYVSRQELLRPGRLIHQLCRLEVNRRVQRHDMGFLTHALGLLSHSELGPLSAWRRRAHRHVVVVDGQPWPTPYRDVSGLLFAAGKNGDEHLVVTVRKRRTEHVAVDGVEGPAFERVFNLRHPANATHVHYMGIRRRAFFRCQVRLA